MTELNSDENIYAFVNYFANNDFQERVLASQEVATLVRRIEKLSSDVPASRAVIKINSLNHWFSEYRVQIVWDAEATRDLVQHLKSEDSKPLQRGSKEIVSNIADIKITPGLIDINYAADSENRIYRSRALLRTENAVSQLREALIVIAIDSVFSAASRWNGVKDQIDSYDAEETLNNDSGSVVFKEQDGKIEIVAGLSGETTDLRALIADALDDLTSSSLLERADNHNRRAAELVRNYAAKFHGNDPDRDIGLYAAGVKIFSSMTSIETPTYEDDRPPQEFIDAVKTLLIHHEAYVWSIPRIREVIENRRKTRESYSINIAETLNTTNYLLKQLVDANSLVGTRSRETIQQINDLNNSPTTIGLGSEAIQYGLLRGSLQFMGRLVVQAKRAGAAVAKAASIKVGANITTDVIKISPLYNPTVQFIHSHIDKLIVLATSSPDWNWLGFVLNLLGLR